MDGEFRLGPWLVSPSLNTISREGATLHLEPKMMDVLVCLAQHPGDLVSKEQLIDTVWAGTFVTDDVLKRAISELRHIFEDDAHEPHIIGTIPKRGYRLLVPVERVPGKPGGNRPGTVVRNPQEATTAPRSTSLTSTSLGRRTVAALVETITEYRKAKRVWMAIAGVLAVVAVVAVIVVLKVGPPLQRRPGKVRLAVLPFQNLSGDPSQDYFSSGLTDELITQLGRLNPARLGIIAATSSMMIRGKSIPEIGREFNVQYVVEGSVRRSGSQVRIDVQLIQASDDTHIWSSSYTRELSDILRVQSEVSEAVARQIPANLQFVALPDAPRVDPKAHDAYLKAKLYLNNRSDLRKSAALFQEAIQDDPNFAAAYAGLADAYITSGEAPYDEMLPREANQKGQAAARRALELDPSLAQAHAALGLAAFTYDWNLGVAEREYRRALELDPGDPAVHEWLGLLLMAEGKTAEALQEGQHSLDLDPVSPPCHAFIAQAYYYAGDYDKAIEESRYVLEIYPRFLQARYWLGSAYLRKGMFPQAIEQFRLAKEMSPDNSAMVLAYGYAQAVAGNKEEARAALRDLESARATRHVPAVYFAGIYLGLGDNRSAMKYLNDAYQERDDRLIYLAVEPMVGPLRSDPDFRDLVRRIGLDNFPTRHGS